MADKEFVYGTLQTEKKGFEPKMALDFGGVNGAIREGYLPIFHKVLARWREYNEAEFLDMTAILTEAANRVVQGGPGKCKSVAVYMVAATRKSGRITRQQFTQLLEVVGVMFKYGMTITMKMQEEFGSDEFFVKVTSNILKVCRENENIRQRFGRGSRVELQRIEALFGVNG